MRLVRITVLVLTLVFIFSGISMAGDFPWMGEFDMRARADMTDFRMRLATCFHIGDSELSLIIDTVQRPADAYMVLRVGKMAGVPVEKVLETYSRYKGRGWGVIAKRLGIKPGSRQFHELKAGQDLYAMSYHGTGKRKAQHKGRHGKW